MAECDVLVTPLPGVGREHLRSTLNSVYTDVSNLRGGGGAQGYYKRLLAYLEWTNSAVDRLGSLISSADIERLVLTKRFEQLLAGVASLADKETERLTNTLVSLELRQRTEAFEAALKTLDDQLRLWQGRGVPVVADTSFYVKHPAKFDEADLAELLGIQDDAIHLIVPMVVVDELDDLKESKAAELVKWRARYTLAVLDRLFQTSMEQATLREPDLESVRATGVRRGEVTVELLF